MRARRDTQTLGEASASAVYSDDGRLTWPHPVLPPESTEAEVVSTIRRSSIARSGCHVCPHPCPGND
jgi:hypothetical protein